LGNFVQAAYACVRLKLDCDCVVYGSARQSVLESLDRMCAECGVAHLSCSIQNVTSFKPA